LLMVFPPVLVSLVIARSKATKQSSFLGRGDMDCFAEPVIGRAFATRWLAMTGWPPSQFTRSGHWQI